MNIIKDLRSSSDASKALYAMVVAVCVGLFLFSVWSFNFIKKDASNIKISVSSISQSINDMELNGRLTQAINDITAIVVNFETMDRDTNKGLTAEYKYLFEGDNEDPLMSGE